MGVSSAAAQKQAGLDDGDDGKGRLGGARADFVANLGRRRVEIATTLDLLRDDPKSARHRDDLRRRIHALGAGARLLRFTALSEELRRLEDRLAEAAERGGLDENDLDATLELLSRVTSLAWGQSGTKSSAATLAASSLGPAELRKGPAAPVVPSAVPTSVLVVGPTALGAALAMPADANGVATLVFEIEQTGEVDVGIDLAKVVAPDLIVVDGDMKGAVELVESLSTDALTELIPVIVVGRFTRSEDASKFVALGVARTLPKPASPGELRRACANVLASYVRREIVCEDLGVVNLDQLGARLAEELRRGLSDSADIKGREGTVNLGEGTEVLAALWGAVARIRDIVTIKSQGALRFSAGGPEGAMPLAPWLGGSEGTPFGARAPFPRSVRSTIQVSLENTKIVVADDDPAVTWFLAGVLKAAGASVYEARDGERAFEIAKHAEPDLVISDILMPKLDGFALCRALKRDVVLRDVPVVLLSWKEDLLQRVRELGADADGYLRKEASAGAIVQRVRELLRLRHRVAERIAQSGEMRGRLDGLTTSTLLRLVCKLRPSSTMSVRDASYLYEIEVREGRPVRATRTSAGGAFDRGPSVLAALLSVGDGRFVVAPTREDDEVAKVRFDLSGTLAEQLMPVVACARAAQRLLVGANLVRVQRVSVDEERLEAYLFATPEPARGVLRSIAKGASPRALITSGQVSPRLLEDVLGDAAIHGAICEIIDAQGIDRLPEGTSHELMLLRGERAAQPITTIPVLAIPAMTPFPSPAVEVSMPGGADLMKAALSVRVATPAPPAAQPYDLSARPDMQPAFASSPETRAPFVDAKSQASFEPGIESSFAALILPPMMGASGLDDPWFSEEAGAPVEESPLPPSGPRPLTPLPRNVRTPSPRPVAELERTPTPSELPPPPGLKPMLSLGSLHPPPVTPDLDEEEVPKAKKLKSPKPAEVTSKKERETLKVREITPEAPATAQRPIQLPSAYLPHAHQVVVKKDRKALYWVLFALCGVSFALWARWSRDKHVASEDALMTPATSHDADPAVPSTASPTAPVQAPSDGDKASLGKDKSDDATPEDLPLRDGDKDRVKKGQGMLEIVAGKSDTVYIDGKPMGSGPVIDAPLKAKSEPYEVKVKLRGEERVRFVGVKEGRLTRVRVAPPWSR